MIVTLGNDWEHCPLWWKAFVTDFRTRHESLILLTDSLNEELTTYHAVKTKDEFGNSILEFESEQYFTWFVLKWT